VSVWSYGGRAESRTRGKQGGSKRSIIFIARRSPLSLQLDCPSRSTSSGTLKNSFYTVYTAINKLWHALSPFRPSPKSQRFVSCGADAGATQSGPREVGSAYHLMSERARSNFSETEPCPSQLQTCLFKIHLESVFPPPRLSRSYALVVLTLVNRAQDIVRCETRMKGSLFHEKYKQARTFLERKEWNQSTTKVASFCTFLL
jgi:hypothetical protein